MRYPSQREMASDGECHRRAQDQRAYRAGYAAREIGPRQVPGHDFAPCSAWQWRGGGVGSLRDGRIANAGYFRSSSLSAAVASAQRISSISRDRLRALDLSSSTFQLSGCWVSSWPSRLFSSSNLVCNCSTLAAPFTTQTLCARILVPLLVSRPCERGSWPQWEFLLSGFRRTGTVADRQREFLPLTGCDGSYSRRRIKPR